MSKLYRRNMNKIFFLLLAVVLGSSGLFAQENKKVTLTVEEAVDYALKNSKALKSSEIDLEIKKRGNAYSWNTFLPSVSVSGTGSRASEYNSGAMMAGIFSGLAAMEMDPTQKMAYQMAANSMADKDFEKESERWTVVGSINAQWSFNLAMVESIKVAHLQYENGLISWEQTVSQTEVNIQKLFYGLLVMQENLNIQKDNLDNAWKRYQQARTDYQNGIVPELSVLNSQVTYENQRPNVLSTEHQLKQQKDTFAFLLGLPYGTELELVGTISVKHQSLNADELVQKYVEGSPDIVSLQNNIKLLKASLAASQLATYTPSVVVSYGYQPVVSDVEGNWFDKDNFTNNGSLSFTLAFSDLIGMLPFSANGQKMKDTKQQIAQAELGLAQLIQNKEIEVHKLCDNLYLSHLNITSMQNNVILAEKAYRSTLSSYNDGTTDLLSVKDSENSLSQARLGLMSERYNYISALLDLEYLLNIKLH